MRQLMFSLCTALLLGACASTSPVSTGGQGTSAPVCKVGQDVHYDAARNFHIDTLVVEDGARAFDAISKQGNDAGQILYKTVGRYFGPMTVAFSMNVHPNRLPSHLPVLIGNGYCLGMFPVMSLGDGWSTVIVPVHGKAEGGPVVNGQVALVLPRAPLTRLVDTEGKRLSFMPAVSLNIPTKYNPPIIRGRFAGQSNTQISKPSGTPGVSWAEKRVLDGEKASLFYFVRGSN